MRDTFEATPRLPVPAGRILRGGHVLAMAVAFFGIVFAVNGVFLFAALSTHTGVIANEPYRNGLAYNSRIADGDEQAALGWRETVILALDGRLSLHLTDQDGMPVRGLRIEATIGRPSTSRFDKSAVLAEGADGSYAAQFNTREGGGWIVTIEARASGSDAPKFRSRRRLWLNS